MTILNVGGSPLGAAYRSRLGVLTRGGEEWRMILVFPESQFGGLGPVEIDAVRARYYALKDELAQTRKVTLTENRNWVFELANDVGSNASRVRNLVFIYGGASPARFRYFQNYMYGPGGDLPIYSGLENPTLVQRHEQLNPDQWPSVITAYNDDKLDDWLAAVKATNTIQDTSIPGSSTKDVCSKRSHSFKTNYNPTFDEMKTVQWEEDKQAWLPEMRDAFTSAKTFFFWDPGDIPNPLGRFKQIWRRSREFQPYTSSIDLDFWLHWSIHAPPPSPPSGVLVNPLVVNVPDILIGTIQLSSTSGQEGTYVQWVCSDAGPASGFLTEFIDIRIEPNGTQTESVVGQEGVDQSHDSTATTDSMIQAMIADYTPESSRYAWTYSGRVDSYNLNAADITAAMVSA